MSTPSWQLPTPSRKHTDASSKTSKSMLGSIKSKFGRKGSTRSTPSSDITASQTDPTITANDVAELPADMNNLNVLPLTPAGGRDFTNSNQSPATRRPPPVINEPPPAYSETSTRSVGATLTPTVPVPRSASPAPSISSQLSQADSPYAFLSSFDTILLIDDSGSMAGRSWREVRAALTSLLPTILAHDKDGIDIFFLNHKTRDEGSVSEGVAPGGYRNVRTAADVDRIFQTVRPSGGTPTGVRCRAILKPYLAKLEAENKKGLMDSVKPVNILAITDGVPSDDVETVLLNAAKKLDALDAAPHQIGIQFFQVGNEEGAAEALKELDDELSGMVEGGVRDIVDTCTWMGGAAEDGGELKLTADGILKVVLGAVVKRIDRRRVSGEVRRP